MSLQELVQDEYVLATMNDDYSEDVLIKVPVKINELELLVTCRIIDKEDPFYDIINQSQNSN